VRFRTTRTCTYLELHSREDSRSDEHRYLASRQHQLVIRTTSDTVAKKSLASEGASARSEEDRSDAGCEAELLLERKFRGMRERADEEC